MPTGERDPRVLYRTGHRGKHREENEVDSLHLGAAASRTIFNPSPMDHAAALVVAAGAAIRRPLARTYLYAHQSLTEFRDRTRLYEWADGEITMTSVRRRSDMT